VSGKYSCRTFLFFELGVDLKTATWLIIEECCKYGGGIKIGITKKIDLTVHAHESDRAHIANRPVALNRFEAHRCGLVAKWILADPRRTVQTVKFSDVINSSSD
jgi:hypothetical protein